MGGTLRKSDRAGAEVVDASLRAELTFTPVRQELKNPRRRRDLRVAIRGTSCGLSKPRPGNGWLTERDLESRGQLFQGEPYRLDGVVAWPKRRDRFEGHNSLIQVSLENLPGLRSVLGDPSENRASRSNWRLTNVRLEMDVNG
jgi:hypothetical protein